MDPADPRQGRGISGSLIGALEAAYHEAIDYGFLGPREGERLRERHIDDALGLAQLRRPAPGERWVDLGSGAGLPGLPLAASFPSTSFTLVDAQQRRLDWVGRTAARLGIQNITTVHSRLEDFGRSQEREQFDVATARALGPLPVVAELGLPLLRVGGLLIVPRGQPTDLELGDAAAACELLGGRLEGVVPNPTGSIDPVGFVVMMAKTASTSPRFPRRPGMPARNPLGQRRPKAR
jgi:16S rRNA (guanine527-N7)-methyltransferase